MSVQINNVLWLGYDTATQTVSINRNITNEKIELNKNELVDLAANLQRSLKPFSLIRKWTRKVAEAMVRTIAQRRKYKLPIF